MKKPSMPALSCMCATLRRASRVLTQHYDEEMRPLGLRATQFTILQALSLVGEISQGRLGEILALDSTTLTRTLEIMLAHGWIVKQHGKDRRERRLRLSKAGEAQFTRTLPTWQAVQERLRRQLGKGRWDNLMNLSNEVTSAVSDKGVDYD